MGESEEKNTLQKKQMQTSKLMSKNINFSDYYSEARKTGK